MQHPRPLVFGCIAIKLQHGHNKGNEQQCADHSGGHNAGAISLLLCLVGALACDLTSLWAPRVLLFYM